MRCICNQVEGGEITILKGADTILNIILIGDMGEDLTEGTITARFYTANNRSGTSFSITITNNQLVIESSNSDIAYNTTYYVYVELELLAYGGIYVSQTPFTVQVI